MYFLDVYYLDVYLDVYYIIPLTLQAEETEVKGEVTSVFYSLWTKSISHLFIWKLDNNESDYVTYFGGRVLRFLIWIDNVY